MHLVTLRRFYLYVKKDKLYVILMVRSDLR